jgi:DNA processing protein
MDLQEQACWLLLVFECGLSTRVVSDILVVWCKQLGRSLQEFFEADSVEWSETCHLGPEIIQKLEQAKEKLVGQIFLAEQLQHEEISMMTVLDPLYPILLKAALTRSQIPSILFFVGDALILDRQTIAIIGSRNANEISLTFTREIARYLADQGANVISGHARGVDRAAFDGAISSEDGHTTVVLPHGIRKLSKVQVRDLQPKIESGNVLLLSQFHPDAAWTVSRAMERNHVVTGLAQIVIAAQSDTKGGTWEGANDTLKQEKRSKKGRRLYVRQPAADESLPGNILLLEKGGLPLPWPVDDLNEAFSHILELSNEILEKQLDLPPQPDQLSLLTTSESEKFGR